MGVGNQSLPGFTRGLPQLGRPRIIGTTAENTTAASNKIFDKNQHADAIPRVLTDKPNTSGGDIPVKRGRGRPRKIVEPGVADKPKRGRGRPRKVAAPVAAGEPEFNVSDFAAVEEFPDVKPDLGLRRSHRRISGSVKFLEREGQLKEITHTNNLMRARKQLKGNWDDFERKYPPLYVCWSPV